MLFGVEGGGIGMGKSCFWSGDWRRGGVGIWMGVG